MHTVLLPTSVNPIAVKKYIKTIGTCNNMLEVIREREFSILNCLKGECKLNNTGKAIPLKLWTGPEGSRKLKLTDFKTSAYEFGKVVSPMHRPP
jgi:hypothetical protein